MFQDSIRFTTTDSGVIVMQLGHNWVRLGLYVNDPIAGVSYESCTEYDDDFIMAAKLFPLHECWHHAMVFFGVVEPDAVSHPPAK